MKKGKKMVELKRKKTYPYDMCAAKGCRRKTTLDAYMIGEIAVPLCETHGDGLEPLPDVEDDGEGVDSNEAEGKATESQEDTKEEPADERTNTPSPDQIREIRRLHSKGKDPSAISIATEVALSAVQRITRETEKGKIKKKSDPVMEQKATGGAIVYAPSDELRGKLESEVDEASQMITMIDEFEIDSQDMLEFAGGVLSEIKSKYKDLENKKQAAVRPMNQALREIRSWFKDPQNLLKEVERKLKQKILDYNRAMEAARKEAMEKTHALMQGDAEPEEVETALAEVHEAEEEQVSNIQYRKVWKWRLEGSIHDVPGEYLLVDSKAVMRDREKGVDGIEFYQEKIVASV